MTYARIGKYSATAPTLSDGETTFLRTNVNGDVFVGLSGSNALTGAIKNVTTAGTRVALGSAACREVTIIAKRLNAGYIYVGGSDVSSTVYGAELAAKDSITLAVSNTNLIYIDASVAGEGVSYVAI